MKLSEAASKAIFKVRIDLGAHMGLAKPTDAWVKLREPSYAELAEASVDGDAKTGMKTTVELLPALIVEHNFEGDDGKPATSEQVAAIIRSSASLFVLVMTAWQAALPLAKRTTQG